MLRPDKMPKSPPFDINPAAYDWSVRIFRTLKRLLGIRLKLHAEKAQIQAGEIFLFNHFSRFETFIPQYLIYEKTGDYCCSVASGEFFGEESAMGNFLAQVGAIPHDHDRLLPLLAEQVLRGRKVIIFPEGGMVKDRRVVDESGQYSIFSRSAMDRRKQHTGAGVLALGLDIFKKSIDLAHKARKTDLLERWAEQLKMNEVEELLAAARRHTLIIPANITFYPIRISGNFLSKGIELTNMGLTRRHSEEILIESNLILKETDLDIRLAEPVDPRNAWSWWEKMLLSLHARKIETLDEVFIPRSLDAKWYNQLLRSRMRSKAKSVRNEYMHKMYGAVTVNMSHLASSVIMQCLERGRNQISRDLFRKVLYLAVKRVQKIPSLYLHESVRNPENYDNLILGENKSLEQYISLAESAALIEPIEGHYRFLPKLQWVHDFDEIRMENPVAVYNNEIMSISAIAPNVAAAIDEAEKIGERQLAESLFDDEMISWRLDKEKFSKPRHAEINAQETATRSGAPFFLRPKRNNGVGVLLIHGFLASPAEVLGYGTSLADLGYMALGVRLKGHGTSPWDLRERSWEEWFESVSRGYRILRAYTDRILMVGFSTGGTLALRFAADQPDGLIGLAALNIPIKFCDSRMMYVPIIHGTNTLARWFSSYEGIKPFIQNIPEHPDINYRNIPIRGLYELRRLIAELLDRLPDVHCPTLLIQGDNDPIVAPESVETIRKRMRGGNFALLTIPSDRHGILFENIADCQEKITAFLARCHSPLLEEREEPSQSPREIEKLLKI